MGAGEGGAPAAGGCPCTSVGPADRRCHSGHCSSLTFWQGELSAEQRALRFLLSLWCWEMTPGRQPTTWSHSPEPRGAAAAAPQLTAAPCGTERTPPPGMPLGLPLELLATPPLWDARVRNNLPDHTPVFIFPVDSSEGHTSTIASPLLTVLSDGPLVTFLLLAAAGASPMVASSLKGRLVAWPEGCAVLCDTAVPTRLRAAMPTSRGRYRSRNT